MSIGGWKHQEIMRLTAYVHNHSESRSGTVDLRLLQLTRMILRADNLGSRFSTVSTNSSHVRVGSSSSGKFGKIKNSMENATSSKHSKRFCSRIGSKASSWSPYANS